MSWVLHKFEDDAALVTALARHVAALLNSGIGGAGKATLAVSGGSTPVGLFNRLGRQQVDWSRVAVTLVDERWLPPDHEDSNALLVRRELLKGPAAAAEFVGLSCSAQSPFDAESEINERLDSLPWPPTVIILGMGSDGHIASLFPGAATLPLALAGRNSRNQDSLCCAVTPPEAPHERMSLTLPSILQGENLFLHIRGKGKLEVLERAINDASATALPVAAVLHQEDTTLQIFYSET